jgi:PAS domain S-box-containing protein
VDLRIRDLGSGEQGASLVAARKLVHGAATYFRDVARERAEHEQLRLLRSAVSHQNDLVLITEAGPVAGGQAPKIVYVNEAFERHTGYTASEVIGKTPRILQGPLTSRAELGRIRAALEDWQPVHSQLINYTRDGRPFWLEIDIVPLRASRRCGRA